ncbi:MAG: hypothetical protein HY723_05170 [Chloroflexi bacterium]|nr:hypothetical protein [Chloroflexota bacterium]
MRSTADLLGLMAYLTLVTGRPPDRALVSEVLRQSLDGEPPNLAPVPARPASAVAR